MNEDLKNEMREEEEAAAPYGWVPILAQSPAYVYCDLFIIQLFVVLILIDSDYDFNKPHKSIGDQWTTHVIFIPMYFMFFHMAFTLFKSVQRTSSEKTSIRDIQSFSAISKAESGSLTEAIDDGPMTIEGLNAELSYNMMPKLFVCSQLLTMVWVIMNFNQEEKARTPWTLAFLPLIILFVYFSLVGRQYNNKYGKDYREYVIETKRKRDDMNKKLADIKSKEDARKKHMADDEDQILIVDNSTLNK